MYRYLAQRLAQAVVVVWAAFTVTFVILYMMPSDPAELIAGGGADRPPATPAQLEALRHSLGVDRPMIVQYWSHLSSMIKGDWGASVVSGRPVLSGIGEALPKTLALAGIALAMSVVFGSLLGFAATYIRTEWLRNLVAGLPSIGASVPVFWSGLMLLQVFSFRLKLFPAFGASGFSSDVLPAVALAIPVSAWLAQVLMRGLEAQLAEPYTATARAKGASRLRIQVRHAGRIALLPVLTTLATICGSVLAGTVVIETVFGRPGFGRLVVTSVNAQDLPVVQGLVVFAAAVYATVNLAVDLVYPLLDPRVTDGRKSRHDERQKSGVAS